VVVLPDQAALVGNEERAGALLDLACVRATVDAQLNGEGDHVCVYGDVDRADGAVAA